MSASDDIPALSPDLAATAAYTAVWAELFPIDHPGAVRTVDDDDDAEPTLSLPPPPSSPAFPETPGFNVLERIGRGGQGEVYRAWDEKLRRMVALKLLRADTPTEALRLEHEAELLARCIHPSIVHVYQVSAHSGTRVFIAMEYIHGTTLAIWATATRRKRRDILRLLSEVGDALDAAHAVGVVHRDVKPLNIMVDRSGHAKLIDFGLAHVAPDPVPAGAANDREPLVGTYDYIAPEHRSGGVCSPRSDQYGFCVVMFECLYGHLPTAADTTRRRYLSARVHRAILRGLHEDPARRWPSMRPLLNALAPRPWWRHPLTIISAVCAGIFLIVSLARDWRRARQADADFVVCTSELADRRERLLFEASTLGMAANVQSLASMHNDLCRTAIYERDPHQLEGVQLFKTCLDTHIEALQTFVGLQQPNPTIDDGPRTRLKWSDLRSLLPPLPMCEQSSDLSTATPAQQTAIALQFVQLRLLLQQQRYNDARRLLDREALIPRLRDLKMDGALAEALLYAGQIARRFQQETSLRDTDIDADDLLNAAEAAAERNGHRYLVAFIRMERINLMLDMNDAKGARMLLESTQARRLITDSELQVRQIQIEARIANIDGDPVRATALTDDALTRVQAEPRLQTTTLHVELLGSRAIYTKSLEMHRFAVEAAQQKLGPLHYLTGVIAANASRQAFTVGAIDDGEAWGQVGLKAFGSTFGEVMMAVEQLEYDLGYRLLIAGEAERALKYADLALGHARQLDSPSEVTFSLFLRSAIELRTGHLGDARRSATEAIASFPQHLDNQPGFKYLLDVGLFNVEAELGHDVHLNSRLRGFQASIQHPTSGAFTETFTEVLFLRAQVLARLGRLREAAEQLSQIADGQLEELADPILRGDFYLLRAYLAEQSDDHDTALTAACTAEKTFIGARTDGRRRLAAWSSNHAALPPAPSHNLLSSCSPFSITNEN